ncbi:MAG: hybrid sensor histidine kinase/response regulator [Mariprofundaceae bacterium]
MKIILMLLAFLSSDVIASENSPLEIQKAHFLKSDQSSIPNAELERWQPRDLPDYWRLTMPDQGGLGWYRVSFERHHLDKALWAIYIPGISMTGDLYLNGTLVGTGGSLQPPYSRNWFRPQLFPFPATLLLPGENNIHIRIAGYPNGDAGLYGMTIGHYNDLKPIYETQWWVKILSTYILTILMLAVGFAVLIPVSLLRANYEQLWFAAASFAAAIFSTNYWVYDIPFERNTWESIIQFSVGFYGYALFMFLSSTIDVRWPRFQYVCFGYLLIGISLSCLPTAQITQAYHYWHSGALMLGIWISLLMALHFKRFRNYNVLGMLLGLGIAVGLAAFDWLAIQSEHPISLFQFGPTAIVMIAAWLWLNQLVQALKKHEHINLHLHELVEQKSEALTLSLHEAESANRSKTRFFAAANHDLRQPLHAIALFVAAIEPYIEKSQGLPLLNQIRGGMANLNMMFDQLLDMSRFESGVIEAKFQHVPLEPILNKLYQEYFIQCKTKKLSLRLHNRDVWIHSDPVLLERVIRNLLSNAVHYTDKGGVLMGCRLRENIVRIEIWDSGQGIAKEHLTAIFEAFHQLYIPGRDRGKGVGLGLAIAQQVSELLNLELKVRSIVGKGSVFSLEVPTGRNEISKEEAPVDTTTMQNIESGVALHDKRIWIVDDDKMVLEGMEFLLESWGCQSSCFNSKQAFQEALSIKKVFPELLITDLHLEGGQSGADVIRLLRESHQSIPAILMTADKSARLPGGLDGNETPIFHKPVDTTALHQKLIEMLV